MNSEISLTPLIDDELARWNPWLEIPEIVSLS
jgi:hypothetical protein